MEQQQVKKELWFIKINCKPELKEYVKKYCEQNNISIGKQTRRLLYAWIKEQIEQDKNKQEELMPEQYTQEETTQEQPTQETNRFRMRLH